MDGDHLWRLTTQVLFSNGMVGNLIMLTLLESEYVL